MILPTLLFSLLAPPQPLSALRDRHRVLVVFSPSDADPRFTEQLHLLEHHDTDLRDRDLILIRDIPHPDASASQRAQQAEQRARFRIAPGDFAVILLGKDGGEKLRQHTPITIEKLNSTIDAMPMRQEEMRQPK